MNYYTLIFWILLFVRENSSEFFTSLEDMKSLLETQAVLIAVLDDQSSAMGDKSNKLNKYLEKLKREQEKANKDVEEYLYNPVNAFLTIKRLTIDRKEIEDIIYESSGLRITENIYVKKFTNAILFPQDDDLRGAANAIILIQQAYNISASSIARGKFNGARLSAHDCFEIGKRAYELEDYHFAKLWLIEAKKLYKKEKETVPKLLLEYLSVSLFETDSLDAVIKVIHQLFPKNETEKKKEYAKKLLEKKREFENTDATEDDLRDLSACNIEKFMKLEEDVKAKLKCRLTDLGNPFLKLARVKEEEAFLNPKILLYHDMLSDKEINIIKALAKPKLERATVFLDDTGEKIPATYRTSKSAWLENDDHPLMEVINKRVEDITGLSTETGEDLQIGNYGIAGHYAPHFDFFEDIESEVNPFRDVGNRIATILFYMSDVAQGGETIFRDLKVYVSPKKGMAAFWYNMLPSGSVDRRTIHAACPVLIGNKWVSNKWLHERGQEFRRPCGLTEHDP